MKTRLFRRALPAFSLLPTLALAHTGHGLIDGAAHYLTPEHLLPVIVAIAVIAGVLAWRKGRR